MKIIEIEHKERKKVEAKRKSKERGYTVLIEDDEENLVEDIETGRLHPTKIAKMVEVQQIHETVCKKCSKKKT